MDDDNDKESSKIIKQHNVTFLLLKELKKKRTKLAADEEKLRNHQDRFNRELMQINAEIEANKVEIDRLLNDEKRDRSSNGLGADEISTKCERILDGFFNPMGKSYIFNIEYNSNQIEGKLEPNEDYTFLALKQKLKRQFDKSENEFYFADERGFIYLDELSVKKCLFPLKKVNVKGLVPVVIVLDKKSKFDNVSNENSKIKHRGAEEANVVKKSKVSMKDMFKEFLKANAFTIFHLVIFVLFIVMWWKSILFFRNIEYALITNNFLKDSAIYNSNVDSMKLLPALKKKFSEVLQFPTEEELKQGKVYVRENTKLFNQLNKNMNYFRIIQKRRKKITCDFPRFGDNLNNKNITCFEYVLVNNNDTLKKADATYLYLVDSDPKHIKGAFDNYDNSGFYFDINIQDPKTFYDEINFLINNEWLDSETFSVMVYINYYNYNLDLFTSVRVLYENQGAYYLPFVDFSLLDITPVYDPYLIFAIIFSLVHLVNTLIFLRTNERADKYKPKHVTQSGKTFCSHCSFFRYLYYHYRMPNALEILSLANILFTYTCMILKQVYLQHASIVKITSTSFNDFLYLSIEYEFFFSMCSLNIFIYMFSVLEQCSYLFDEVRIINESILACISSSYSFTLFYVGIFTFFSTFLAYYMFGDFSLYYYRNLDFIFSKVVAMFYRGTVESVDFEKSINKYKVSLNDENSKYQWAVRNSLSSCINLSTHSGYLGFFLFSLLFYFVANFVIKVAQTAFFIVIYRQKFEEDLKKQRNIKKQIK